MTVKDDTAVSNLAGAIRAGVKVATAEVTPPVSADAQSLIDKARPLIGVVDAANVTDGAGARSHMSNLAAAAILAREGLEPVLQFTCRDRNRIALQSDLLGAGAFGIHNVMFLTGDDPKQGDQPDAKPVFDLSSTQLIEMARAMSETAKLPSGRDIETPPSFFIGAADLPMDPPADWKPTRLAEKVDAGVAFIQTQFCYDVGIIERWVARLRDAGLTDRLAVLIGTGPIRSARSARWMRENLFGVVIPDPLVDRLEGAQDQKKEGQKICVEHIQAVTAIDGVAGVHVMAINQDEAIPGILEAAGIGPRAR